jgi:hypothetical protein
MIPAKSPKYKPDQTLIPDETLQGTMVAVQDLIRGMRYDSHGWDSYPYLDSFPIFVCAELGSSDNKTAAPASTTLAAAAAVGDTTITVAATVAALSWIIVGSGATLESHFVASVATDVLTLASPIIYAQASGNAVTGLTKHSFSLLNNAPTAGNQPPSVSIWDNDGEEWRTLTAGQLDELTIKGNATGLVDYTCSFFCNPASPNASAPSTSYTSAETAEPWSFVAFIGGTATPYIEEWEFNFKRGVKPIPALTGTIEYFLYLATTLQATGKLTFVEQSGSPWLNQYLNGTKQTFDFSIFDPEGNVLNLHSTVAMFKTGEIDRSKEYVTVSTEFQLLPSATDALAGGKSPVQITIANQVTTSYTA